MIIERPHILKLELVDASSRLKLDLALSNAGLDWSDWGKNGTSKKIKALLNELKTGESVLYRKPDGELIREVKKAAIDVIYEEVNGEVQRLYEEFYENGSWRRREQKEKTLKRGIQEKILPGETSTIAALRGLKEEIRIADLTTDELSRLVFQHNSMEDRPSRGYPGLFTRYSFSDFTFELPKRFYKLEGYIVKEAGFKTRLVWEKIV